jgi:hypothetical protein
MRQRVSPGAGALRRIARFRRHHRHCPCPSVSTTNFRAEGSQLQSLKFLMTIVIIDHQ